MSEYVYVGAGGLGRKLAALVEPVCFVDRDPAKVGTFVDGVPVMTMAHAVAVCPGAAFVVTIWGAHSAHRIRDTEKELRAFGVRTVPFGEVLCEAGGSHYFIGDLPGDPDGVGLAEALFQHEGESSAVFALNCRARVFDDVAELPEPVAGPTYFPDDLFRYLGDDEIVIDGGAYDGDTLQTFCDHGGTFGKWMAFEPHPVIAGLFHKRVRGMPRAARGNTEHWMGALGAAYGSTWFTDDDTTGAAAVGESDPAKKYRVPVIALDDQKLSPTFIKLDIEGAELDAIRGMAETVRRCRPVMAVCVYHRPADLWEIPLAIHALMPDAKFYLRPHDAEGWDTVCYAVPPERAL